MTDVRWKSLPGVHQRLLCARLRQASVVVTVDPKTPAWLETVLPDLNGGIVALPQWADPGVFHSPRRDDRMAARRRFRERLGLPAESRIVLFAGRLESQKDPLLLVRAFAAVAEAVPEAVLVFLGEGRLAMPVEAAAKDLRIAARVRVSGAVLRSDLAEAYVSSDVVACSSAFESGPRVMFEALACGTPVVSFDVGQIGAILERNPEAGVLVRPRETLSLAAALGQVLSRSSDPDLPARCAAAVREFVPERSLAKLFFCYREWLNGKNR
jgi:glycosyltransferase involved in cell wall biosynthesis